MEFKDMKINLVKHDTSPTGMPCYIECFVGNIPKYKKGDLVLDLGNYIYRTFGLHYQMTPEYRGKGKQTTLRWFMSWEDIQPIKLDILKAFGKQKLFNVDKYLPIEFYSLIIQDKNKGVPAVSRSSEKSSES